MAVSVAATERAYVGAPKRGPITRLLEDERRFIDLANSPVFVAEERPVIDDRATPAR